MLTPSSAQHPRLVIVRGKPGAGKTTLAHRLAAPDALGLPVVSRDVLKAGLVATHGAETDPVRASVVPQAFALFQRTVELWRHEGVSLIADEAFSRERSEALLRSWTRCTEVVVVHCQTSDDEAARRHLEREQLNPRKRADVLERTRSQMEAGTDPWRVFDAFDLGVPALSVDTTLRYQPALEAIVAFCQLPF